MAFLLTTLFLLLTRSLVSMTRSEQVEQATSIARREIERIKERQFPLREGLYDGRIPHARNDGFPPAPYPRTSRGKDYYVVVESKALDERLIHVKVSIYDNDRMLSELVAVLKS